MEKLLDHVGIYVNKDNNRVPYNRIIMDNGISTYFPCGYQNKTNENFGITEVYFFPISLKEFNKANKWKSYYGYQYIFANGKLNTILLGNDDYIAASITHCQMTSEVHRVKYKVKKPLDIVVERVYDSLYPPRIIDIDSPTNKIGLDVLYVTKQLIDEFNSYYINKKI